MYVVRVETEFAAAHFLSRYHGKCEHLHGHNYRVRAWFRSVSTGEGGMVVDFAVVKQALKDAVAPLDHSNLNDDPIFDDNPSAERIAAYIFTRLQSTVPTAYTESALLYAVDVFETSGNMARYEG